MQFPECRKSILILYINISVYHMIFNRGQLFFNKIKIQEKLFVKYNDTYFLKTCQSYDWDD